MSTTPTAFQVLAQSIAVNLLTELASVASRAAAEASDETIIEQRSIELLELANTAANALQTLESTRRFLANVPVERRGALPLTTH